MIKFKTYGEYGCPFNGLMFDLLKEEETKKLFKKYINLNIKHLSEKVRDFSSKKIKRKMILLPKIKRIYNKIFVIFYT